jgi:MFS family permease
MAAGDDRIRRFYIFRAVTSFSLWIPFWTLWLYKNVESMFLLTLVDAAFWITMIAFQIPTGLIGDKYGRKTVLFLGEVLFAVGVLLFGFSNEFWQYLGSNIVWALGVCFIVSGDTPFLYDTLIELKRSNEFITIMSRAYAVMYGMNAAACIVGGILVTATDSLNLTLIVAACVGFAGSFTVTMLREPAVDRRHMDSFRRQLRAGMKMVIFSRPILVLIFFQVVIEIAIYVMAVFRAVYMNVDLGLDYLEIGLFYGSFSVVTGIVMIRAGKIESILGEKYSLVFLFMAVLFSFTIVFVVTSPAAIAVQYLMYTVSGLLSPITNGYINMRVASSQHRSTVIAIGSFIFTAVLTVVEVSAGWAASQFGTPQTMMMLAAALTPVGILLLWVWFKEVNEATKRSPARVPGQY